LDGGESPDVGCMRCAQILNLALADGTQLGSLACAGSAASSWNALSTCAMTTCGSVCTGIMPDNPCVQCLVRGDADGGCSTEMTACVAN
jgi:hypothetical protein